MKISVWAFKGLSAYCYLALLGLELDLHPIPPSMLKVQKTHTGYLQ